MGKTKLDETYIFKISIKMWFDVAICIKIPFFFIVLVAIEPCRSLLQFVVKKDTKQEKKTNKI